MPFIYILAKLRGPIWVHKANLKAPLSQAAPKQVICRLQLSGRKTESVQRGLRDTTQKSFILKQTCPKSMLEDTMEVD